MDIFTKEFASIGQRLSKIVNNETLDVRNLLGVALIVWICILIGFGSLIQFATIGINTWWMQYSVTNPNVLPESTTIYLSFMGAILAIKIALAVQTLFIGLLLYLVLVRIKTDRDKRIDEKQALINSARYKPVTYTVYDAPPQQPDIIIAQPPKPATTPECRPPCPFCNTNKHLIKNGTRDGNNRYYCKECRKYFTIFSIYKEEP